MEQQTKVATDMQELKEEAEKVMKASHDQMLKAQEYQKTALTDEAASENTHAVVTLMGEIERLKNQLQSRERQVTALESQIGATQKEITSLSEALRQAKESLGKAQENFSLLLKAIDARQKVQKQPDQTYLGLSENAWKNVWRWFLVIGTNTATFLGARAMYIRSCAAAVTPLLTGPGGSGLAAIGSAAAAGSAAAIAPHVRPLAQHCLNRTTHVLIVTGQSVLTKETLKAIAAFAKK